MIYTWYIQRRQVDGGASSEDDGNDEDVMMVTLQTIMVIYNDSDDSGDGFDAEYNRVAIRGRYCKVSNSEGAIRTPSSPTSRTNRIFHSSRL